MTSIHNPHDAIAKSFLTNVAVASDFLKAHLPADIVKRCNFDSIKIESSSFIDPKLKPYVSDILYSVKIDNEPGFIYCLIEAQSTPKMIMPLRSVLYLSLALHRYAENHVGKKLPVIVPMLLYTGATSPYPHSVNLYDCFENPALAEQTFLHPKLIDLSVIPDDEIKRHGQAAFLEIISKHVRDRDILNLAHHIVELLKTEQITRDLFRNMLYYVIDTGDSEHYDEFLEIIKKHTTGEYQETTMTIAERLKLEGEQRGYEKGIHAGMQQGMQQGEYEKAVAIARNMLSSNFDHEVIKKLTGLTDQDIAKLVRNH